MPTHLFTLFLVDVRSPNYILTFFMPTHLFALSHIQYYVQHHLI